MSLLREAYIKGPDRGYPEHYAEFIAQNVDRFHCYQKLMEEDNKYAFQAQLCSNGRRRDRNVRGGP